MSGRSRAGAEPDDRLVPPIHPGYVRRIVTTSAVLWVLVRVAVAVLSGAVLLVPGAAVVVIGTVPLLCWFDGRRLNEHLFHRNLGTPVALGVGISVATAVTLEVGSTVLLRWIMA